tara:strand:+ start:363 stop:542 length:180 start_codon:yes stop_codon:yes gene_type:complete
MAVQIVIVFKLLADLRSDGILLLMGGSVYFTYKYFRIDFSSSARINCACDEVAKYVIYD